MAITLTSVPTKTQKTSVNIGNLRIGDYIQYTDLTYSFQARAEAGTMHIVFDVIWPAFS